MKYSILIVMLYAALAAQTPTVPGTISGKVLAPDGKPVAKARVFLAKSQPNPKGYIPVPTAGIAGRIDTASDGSFSFGPILPGSYLLCAQSPVAGHLDPCQWTSNPPVITLTSGGKVLSNVTLTQGAVVTVRLNDPQNIIASQKVNGRAPHIVAGYYNASNLFFSKDAVTKDAGGQTYAFTVPFNKATNFHVFSSELDLLDDAGQAVAAVGKQSSVQVAEKDPPKTITVQIKGLKPGK